MENTTKSLPWKIYFWIVIINAVFVYPWQGFSRLWEIADLLIFLMAVVGLFAFVWKKVIFSIGVWKAYFTIQILWNIFYLFILPLPEKIMDSYQISQITASTITVIFYIPLFYALYVYSFKQKVEIGREKLQTVTQ